MNTIVLLACGLITVGVLVYVFYLPGKLYLGPQKTRLSYLRERRKKYRSSCLECPSRQFETR